MRHIISRVPSSPIEHHAPGGATDGYVAVGKGGDPYTTRHLYFVDRTPHTHTTTCFTPAVPTNTPKHTTRCFTPAVPTNSQEEENNKATWAGAPRR